MTPRTGSVVLAAVLGLVICGCGIQDPYQFPANRAQGQGGASASSTSSTTTATPADAGDPPSERGGTIPKPAQDTQDKLTAGAPAATPQAALERYASVYVNWSASTVIAHQRQLAAISLGQARLQALQAAASAARDPELTRSQVANHGELIALTPGTGTVAGEWVLVTREQTTGQGNYAGLPATLHVIYAQLTHANAGWLVTQWTPQT